MGTMYECCRTWVMGTMVPSYGSSDNHSTHAVTPILTTRLGKDMVCEGGVRSSVRYKGAQSGVREFS